MYCCTVSPRASRPPFVVITLSVGVGAWHGDARHNLGAESLRADRNNHARTGSSLEQKMTQEIEMQEPAIDGARCQQFWFDHMLTPHPYLRYGRRLRKIAGETASPAKTGSAFPRLLRPPPRACRSIVSRTPKPPCLPCRETDGRASQLLGLSSFAYSFAYLILNPDPVYARQ